MTGSALSTALEPVFQDAADRAYAQPPSSEQPTGGDHEVFRHAWSQPAWDLLAAAEVPWVGVPESSGGAGGTLADAFELARLAGRHAIPLPVAETALAGRWLARAGLPVPRGSLTVAPGARGDDVVLTRSGDGWRLDADLHRVPWGAQADHVVILAVTDAGDMVLTVPRGSGTARPGQNLAGEPRDDLHVDGLTLGPGAVAALPPGSDRGMLTAEGAMCRAVQMAGALQAVSTLTVEYAGVREQFGRPIARFQAVAQNLALLAQHSERAQLGVVVSSAHVAARGHDLPTVARAKVLAGEAADRVGAIAHQVHGAIGMTLEYPLGRFTTRLWSWAAEFGSAATWAARLGDHVCEDGGRRLWACATDSLTVEHAHEESDDHVA